MSFLYSKYDKLEIFTTNMYFTYLLHTHTRTHMHTEGLVLKCFSLIEKSRKAFTTDTEDGTLPRGEKVDWPRLQRITRVVNLCESVCECVRV